MGARIVDDYIDCGSVRIALIEDAMGWVIVEGVELSDREALDASHRVGGHRFFVEKDAREAFEARKEPAPDPEATT